MNPAAEEPIRDAVRRRTAGAIERMAREASPDTLAAALAAATDAGMLARLLAEDAAAEAVRRLDPYAAAIARGAEARARLVEAAGGLLTAEAVARLLGVTRQAVDKRRAAGRLLALRIRGDWHYPAAQFQDGEVVPGLADLLGRMGRDGGWSVLDFLLAPDDALGGMTPLDALRAGDTAGVDRLVRARGTDVSA